MGQSLESLPRAKRLERYRQIARDLVRQAQEATTEERRTESLALAASWHALAEEIVRALNPDESCAQNALLPERKARPARTGKIN